MCLRIQKKSPRSQVGRQDRNSLLAKTKQKIFLFMAETINSPVSQLLELNK